jgi:hypothetical protein
MTPDRIEYRPGDSFFGLLEEDCSRAGPRQFELIHVGAFLVSIQTSDAMASDPPGAPPIEDVDSWEVAVFDWNLPPPHCVSPASHPHLFRDARGRPLWHLAEQPAGYWSGRHVPTGVIRDLLDCLTDPAGYAELLAQYVLPGQDPTEEPEPPTR